MGASWVVGIHMFRAIKLFGDKTQCTLNVFSSSVAACGIWPHSIKKTLLSSALMRMCDVFPLVAMHAIHAICISYFLNVLWAHRTSVLYTASHLFQCHHRRGFVCYRNRYIMWRTCDEPWRINVVYVTYRKAASVPFDKELWIGVFRGISYIYCALNWGIYFFKQCWLLLFFFFL